MAVSQSTKSSTDTGNQRVTLAVLATKLDYVLESLKDIKACIDKQNLRIQEQDERIEKLERVVVILKWGGAFISAILIGVGITAITKWLGL
jgi:hypothetical protein